MADESTMEYIRKAQHAVSLPSTTNERYYVVHGSPTGHCCFEAAVVDRREVELANEVYAGTGVVCECFDPEDAERIAVALNQNGPPRGVDWA